MFEVGPPVKFSLPAFLKASTAAAHAKLEKRLDLFQTVQSKEQYICLLEKFYAFYAMFENQIEKNSAFKELKLNFNEFKKLSFLHADIVALKGNLDPFKDIPLIQSSNLSQLTSPAALLGSLYVLEGSTLGGLVIARHFGPKFDLNRNHGLAFFLCYGDEVHSRWRKFQSILEDYSKATGCTEQAALEMSTAANMTFDFLTTHLCTNEEGQGKHS